MKRFSAPSEKLNQRLNMYCVAAGAAGVGLLALAPQANAEIVFYPANVVLSRFNLTNYALDINHDGTRDFYFYAYWRSNGFSGGYYRMYVVPARGNAVARIVGGAWALSAGQRIDRDLKFAGRLMAWADTQFGSGLWEGGNWLNVTHGYLGFEFKIHGEKHYGWARIEMKYAEVPLKATLIGYAYETEANQPIVAGMTSSTEESSLLAPAVRDPQIEDAPRTLGALALGAPSLSAWRGTVPAIARLQD